MEQEYKNLKGEARKIRYFRREETGETKPTTQTRNGKEEIIYTPVLKRVYFTEETVKRFSLDHESTNQEHDMRAGNYTDMPNYYIQFWQPIIGADALAIFLTLRMHCFDKDYCWPSLTRLREMTNIKSPNTLKKKLNILEEYGLIFRFEVANGEDVEGKHENLDESPIIKVRSKIPFLSKDLIEKLPKSLQFGHDKFMQRYMDKHDEVNLSEQTSYDAVYKELLDNGEVQEVSSKAMKSKIARENQMASIKKTLSSEEQSAWNEVLRGLESRVSKPSFETWLKGTIAKQKGDKLIIHAPNNFAMDWLKEHYTETIKEECEKIHLEFDSIEYTSLGE